MHDSTPQIQFQDGAGSVGGVRELENSLHLSCFVRQENFGSFGQKKKKKSKKKVQQQGAHNGGVSCWFRGLPKSTALHCRDGPSVWSTTFFKNFLYYFPPLGVAITLMCKVIWWLRSAMKSGESVDGSGG